MNTREALAKKYKLLKTYENKLEKKKGLADLYFFNKQIIEHDKPSRQENIVPHVHGEWWDWYQGSDKNINLLLVPRNTLKSTFFTVGMCLQRIAKNPDIRILIANATQTNAETFLSQIKNHIRDNERYRELYGDFYNPDGKWTQSEIEVKGRSPSVREPTVTSVGTGGNLVSQHYDLIIADDLVNRENSATRLQADKVIDWWKRSLSLLDPDGDMLIIGTRWAHYELYQHILDEHADNISTYIRSAYNDDGTAYYPELLPLDKLENLRANQDSYVFSSFYLNDPIDEESAIIKKSDLHYYGIECPCGKYHRDPDNYATFITCDPAVSQSTQADFTAIVVVRIDPEGNWFVTEAQHGRWSVDETIERLFSAYNIYQPDGMSIEVIGLAQAMMQTIHNRERLKGTYLPLSEIKSRGGKKKRSRIRSVLEPRFKQGAVFIKPNMAELEDELTRFPRSAHDDLIDALTDVAEIGFRPSQIEEKKKQPVTVQERIHSQLNRSDDYIDPVLGRHF